MSDERLERMEKPIAQLIDMVAENNRETNRVQQRFDALENRFNTFEQRFEAEKELTACAMRNG